jgi:hypothetical protein
VIISEQFKSRGALVKRALIMSWLLLFFCFHPLPRIVAQQEAPLTDRPPTLIDGINFFNAQGRSVKVAWSVDRNTVPEDGELTATLTVTEVAYPQRIVRPDLKKLRDFETRFVITDMKDPIPKEGAREVKFSYLLRPRNRSVSEIPTLEFYYYNPAAAAGKSQFKLTTASKVPITVTDAPKKEEPVIPLRGSDQLFVVTTGPQLLDKRQFLAGFWPWLIVGLAGPLCAIVWFMAWQRVFPDARRLAKMRRSRVARRAIDAIHRASRTSDPPATIAVAVLSYLRTRFPLPPGAVTPIEIETALEALNVATAECAAIAKFFRACDTIRFGQYADNEKLLALDAEALITQMEGV